MQHLMPRNTAMLPKTLHLAADMQQSTVAYVTEVIDCALLLQLVYKLRGGSKLPTSRGRETMWPLIQEAVKDIRQRPASAYRNEVGVHFWFSVFTSCGHHLHA